jgi:hypothetical protein
VQEAHASPRLAFVPVESVQLVAGRDARFAPAAGIEIDLKSELLPGSRFLEREKIPVVAGSRGESVRFVALREALDRGQTLLLVEVLLDERQSNAALARTRGR